MQINTYVPEVVPKLFCHLLKRLHCGIVSFDAVHAYVPL